jgi:hypothetical protein
LKILAILCEILAEIRSLRDFRLPTISADRIVVCSVPVIQGKRVSAKTGG